MTFRCFSLQFTCRARGQRCIPFCVTHTSIELSTKGQALGMNSSLAWIYTNHWALFSPWQQSSSGPGWPERLCNPCPWNCVRIQLNKVLHNPMWSQSQPCCKQGDVLETSWHPIKPAFSYEPITLGQLFCSDRADPWAWSEGEGRAEGIS